MSSLELDRLHEVGKRSALVCVALGLVISLFLILISFVLPFYVSSPYAGYHLNYYYNQVKYSPDINGDTAFNKCGDHSYNNNCNTLSHVTSKIAALNVSALLVIVIVIGLLTVQIFLSKKQKFITNTHIICYILAITLSWCFVTSGIHSYMKHFPNTKYCSYSGDDTGCNWFTAITILTACGCILCILLSVLIGLIAPFCQIFKFLPWLSGGNDDIDNDMNVNINQNTNTVINQNQNENIRDDESINDYHHKPLIASRRRRSNRRKHCAYITIPEWCSIIILSVGFVLINIILILSYFNEWYPSDYQSQTYVNQKWNNSQCIALDGYVTGKPKIYDTSNDTQCSFSYVDSNGQYNNTYWSCCNVDTCNKAFDYKSLMIGYNESNAESDSYKCWIDMQAMTKASCHPNDEWFVNYDFNISAKPKQKQSTQSKLVVCALFCKQTYDHCKNMIWNQDLRNQTVEQVYKHRFDQFCELGLGVELRYEAFTDKCFAGSMPKYIKYSLVFIIFVITLQ